MSRRFFRFLWRVNAVLIALAGSIAILGMLGVGALVFHDWMRPLDVQQILPVDEERTAPRGEEPVIEETVSAFYPLGASGLLRATVTRKAQVSRGSLRDSGGYKETSSEVDWLFYDPEATDPSDATWRLLDQSPALLAQALLLEEVLPDGARRRPQPVAIFARYATRDGNGDGLLTWSDPETLALAGPTGRDLTPLDLPGVFVGLNQRSSREAVLTLKDGNNLRFVHLDLENRTVLRTVETPFGLVTQD